MVDDLILKMWFRRRFLGAERGASAHLYDRAVHGWQAPPFDVCRLQIYPKKRRRRSAAGNRRAEDGERDLKTLLDLSDDFAQTDSLREGGDGALDEIVSGRAGRIKEP